MLAKMSYFGYEKQNPPLFVYKKEEWNPLVGFMVLKPRQASVLATKIQPSGTTLSSYRQTVGDTIYHEGRQGIV